MNEQAIIALIDLGTSLTETILSKFKNQIPAEIVQLGQAFVDAALAHKNDLITKVSIEANRG